MGPSETGVAANSDENEMREGRSEELFCRVRESVDGPEFALVPITSRFAAELASDVSGAPLKEP